jgi:hypothetical protein
VTPSQNPVISSRFRPDVRALPWLGTGLMAGLLALAPVSAQMESGSGHSTSEGSGTSGAAVAPSQSATGAEGAKIYCFMRGAGNTHKVSWEAAYALIKRQSDSLFKTSPQHAAVMITVAVVNNPTEYPDCSKYLGDLYLN